MARGYYPESWGSRFNENFIRGAEAAEGMVTRHVERQREKALREGQQAAVAAGGDFATKADFDTARAKIRETYAANGDMEGLAKADEVLKGWMAEQIDTGLKRVQMAAAEGDMQTVASLLPEVYGYLPTGKTLHTTLDPTGKQVFVTPVDEVTGEANTKRGVALDARGVAELAAAWSGTGTQMAEYYLKKQEALDQRDYQQGTLQLGREGLELEGELGRGRLAQGWAGLTLQKAGLQQEGDIARARLEQGDREIDQRRGLALLENDLRRYQSNVDRQTVRETNRQRAMEWEGGALGREVDTLATLAGADLAHAQALKALGTGGWEADDLRATEGIVSRLAADLSEQGLASGQTIDPVQLGSTTMQIIAANPPGNMSALTTMSAIMGMQSRPDDFEVRDVGGGAAEVLDRRSGERFRAPVSVIQEYRAGLAAPGE